jgi:predicted GIY-YIG superfamily endonuclease
MASTHNPYERAISDEQTRALNPIPLVNMRSQVAQVMDAGHTHLAYLLALARREDFYIGAACEHQEIYALCLANHQQQEGMYGQRQVKPLRLVWLEAFDTEVDALRRCDALRALPHAWQRRVVDAFNPEWIDLDHVITEYPFPFCVHEFGAGPFVRAD